MGLAIAYLLDSGSETTDNAQIEAHIVSINARISGPVAAVLVKDNQRVQKGEVLVVLDRQALEVRLQSAQAELEAARASMRVAAARNVLQRRSSRASLMQARGGLKQARSGLGSSRAAIAQAQADLDAARSRRDEAQGELVRTRKLIHSGAAATAQLDARQAALNQAIAADKQAQARLESARAATSSWQGSIEIAQGQYQAATTRREQMAEAEATVAVARARVKQAEAVLRGVELDLSYCEIRAPTAGLVSRRSVEVGQLVSPERSLMALVSVEDPWVVANFKEDQVGAILPGQAARIRIDAYPDHEYLGHVDSLAGASGSRFALLPPDNASGNFTKVTQRIPVLLHFDQVPDVPLLPGMSVSVSVRTLASDSAPRRNHKSLPPPRR